jgi:hypothetical protein
MPGISGRIEIEPLGFFLFLRGERSLGGLRLGGALLEFVHATRGVHEFLLSGIKRMADVADAHDNGGLGRTRLDHVAAGAADLGVHVFRMNVRLHKKGRKISMNSSNDKKEFAFNADQKKFSLCTGVSKNLLCPPACPMV